MKKTTLTIAALGFVLLTAACNTMEGAGEDIQAGGKNITHAAAESKEDMK
jgi:predicted small secreted protein